MPLVLALLLSGFALWPPPVRALAVPAYRGYVNDYADLLSPATEARLERALQSFDLSDSTQIAVLTIPSLEGEDLEGFSIRTVEGWKIGQKGKDNGVLFLVVKNDRKMRIEVG
ncbi:MAG: TPM domain-containing protein, partial [Desulfobulbaceae bacterium]|nr:TPM domain-containing protein [Desulfobulbaceae bacterium]